MQLKCEQIPTFKNVCRNVYNLNFSSKNFCWSNVALLESPSKCVHCIEWNSSVMCFSRCFFFLLLSHCASRKGVVAQNEKCIFLRVFRSMCVSATRKIKITYPLNQQQQCKSAFHSLNICAVLFIGRVYRCEIEFNENNTTTTTTKNVSIKSCCGKCLFVFFVGVLVLPSLFNFYVCLRALIIKKKNGYESWFWFSIRLKCVGQMQNVSVCCVYCLQLPA